jgi:hypothetical protein
MSPAAGAIDGVAESTAPKSKSKSRSWRPSVHPKNERGVVDAHHPAFGFTPPWSTS